MNIIKQPNNIKFGKNAADYIFVACNSFAAQKKALSIVKQKGTINFFAGISKNRNVNKIDTNLIHLKECKYTLRTCT